MFLTADEIILSQVLNYSTRSLSPVIVHDFLPRSGSLRRSFCRQGNCDIGSKGQVSCLCFLFGKYDHLTKPATNLISHMTSFSVIHSDWKHTRCIESVYELHKKKQGREGRRGEGKQEKGKIEDRGRIIKRFPLSQNFE